MKELVSGIYAIREDVLGLLDDEPVESQESVERRGSLAVVSLSGVVTPARAELFAKRVRDAAADSSVREIMLLFDSPGGLVAGVEEAANAIYAARAMKKTVAFAHHEASSAAYWLASQAEKFYASPNAMVGSIGVMWVHVDLSKMLENDGMKVTMLRSAPRKNEAAPWQSLSDEVIERRQRQLDMVHDAFVTAVARGRGTTKELVSSTFGQGEVLHANQAAERGMVDGVISLHDYWSLRANQQKALTRVRMAQALARRFG